VGELKVVAVLLW